MPRVQLLLRVRLALRNQPANLRQAPARVFEAGLPEETRKIRA